MKMYLVSYAEYDWDDYYPHTVCHTKERAEALVEKLRHKEPDLVDEPGYSPGAYISEVLLDEPYEE